MKQWLKKGWALVMVAALLLSAVTALASEGEASADAEAAIAQTEEIAAQEAAQAEKEAAEKEAAEKAAKEAAEKEAAERAAKEAAEKEAAEKAAKEAAEKEAAEKAAKEAAEKEAAEKAAKEAAEKEAAEKAAKEAAEKEAAEKAAKEAAEKEAAEKAAKEAVEKEAAEKAAKEAAEKEAAEKAAKEAAEKEAAEKAAKEAAEKEAAAKAAKEAAEKEKAKKEEKKTEDASDEDYLLVTAAKGSGSKIHAAASDDSEVLGVLDVGSMLWAKPVNSGWAKVSAGGIQGYVHLSDVIQYITEASGEEATQETAKEAAPVIRTVKVYSSLDGMKQVKEGTEVTLTAKLTGFEDTKYTVQWQYSPDGGTTVRNAKGGNSLKFSYKVSEKNIGYAWRLVVTLDDGQ